MNKSNKILIINCGAAGDILNSTPIAKHHKITDPGCKIDWLTSKKYEFVLKNNKNIDNILLYENIFEHYKDNTDHVLVTFLLEKNEQHFFSNYDIVKFVAPYFYIFKNKIDNNSEEDSLLNVLRYKTSGIKEFACDFIPNVSLDEREIKEAIDFFESIRSDDNKKILLEYENFSNQTPFNINYINLLCQFAEENDFSIIFSGKIKPSYFETLEIKYGTNFYFYKGSFMSNAQLYNLCDLFIGCSSGLSCLTHSDFCDIEKPRIEVSRGIHWSTKPWNHVNNKIIVNTLNDFKDSLGKII